MARYSNSTDPLDPRGYYDSRPLTPEEVERAETLARITRVFTKIDRVLVGSKVEVTLAKAGANGAPPAYSNGKTVTLNTDQITSLDLAGMIGIHGLNYHEVCHMLYSPRLNSDLVLWAQGKRLTNAMNILEDQRIETLMVGRHSAVAPYLSALVLRWLMDDTNKIASNYVLVRGRRHLPLEVRKAFRDAFVAPELFPAIERIVDEYRTLAFPRDEARAKVLIQAFWDEVLSKMPKPTDSCQSAEKTSSGRPEGGTAQEKDSQSAKQQQSEDEADSLPAPPQDPPRDDEEQGEGSQGESGDEQGEQDGESGEQGSEGDEDGEGQGAGAEGEQSEGQQQGEGQGAGQDGQGDAEGQQSTSGQQSSNSGAGQGQGQQGGQGEQPGSDASAEGGNAAGGAGKAADPKAAVESAIREALEGIQNDEQVRSEMDARARSIQKPARDGWFHSALNKGNFYGNNAAAALSNSARKFRQELRRLSEDCDPGWVLEQPSGRLNVGRAMRGADPKEAFDRWAEGNEGSDLEVFIGVDASGSMCSRVGRGGRDSITGEQAANEALWVIASALQGISADVTAVAFGSESHTIYSREDKVGKQVLSVNHGGGTDALPALEEAERLFRASNRKNKLLIMVTDGEWSDAQSCDATMRRIEALGVLSAVAYIDTNGQGVEGDRVYKRYGHGAQVFGGVGKSSDLLPWGKALVKATIKRFGAPVTH